MSGSPLDPSQRARLDDVSRIVERARSVLPRGLSPPCFTHLRVDTRGRARDYLLGWQTRVGDDVTVLQWQTAPLAEAFFACPEGGDYELSAGDRTLEGTVRARNLLEFDPAGELTAIIGGGVRLSRGPDGAWGASPDRDAAALHPRDEAARLRPPSAVEVPLDAHQRAAIARPAGGALLVLGEAGVGKTTVALHRLAHLRRERGGGAFKAAVVVPTEGLRRLAQALLERLDVNDAEVWRYDRWAAKLARRAFLDVPVRESDDVAPGVLRIKRHRALAAVLAEYVSVSPRKGPARRDDLHHLFGDRAWMERVAERSEGDVSARDVADVLEHARVQYTETTEQEYADVVDATRLAALDGRALDAGTPMGDAGTVDVEDYAALFEMDRLRALARGAPTPSLPRRYDALLVDEAQELAPLELALLGRAVAPGGTLIVAGDAGQQVDATACFDGWEATLRDLGAPRYDTATLTRSYRCPAEVTALARRLLDPRAPAPSLEGSRHVSLVRVESECHLAARLVDGLRDLAVSDPRASVAVIVRSPESARRLAGLLGRGADVRLALDGDFRFGPGACVTAVQEVKGLEFDYVVVADAGAYPDDDASRRALYVAVTRAMHQVVLASVGPWSSLVREAVVLTHEARGAD